jgi:hypothetical protein
LIYRLWDQAVIRPTPEKWLPSSGGVYWLYDEVDLWPDGSPGYVHRVLLSDGKVLLIPFFSVLIVEVPLARPAIEVELRCT